MKLFLFSLLSFFSLYKALFEKQEEDNLKGCWLKIEREERVCFMGSRAIFNDGHSGYTLNYQWLSDSLLTLGEHEYLFEKVNNDLVKLSRTDSTNKTFHFKRLKE